MVPALVAVCNEIRTGANMPPPFLETLIIPLQKMRVGRCDGLQTYIAFAAGSGSKSGNSAARFQESVRYCGRVDQVKLVYSEFSRIDPDQGG